MFKFLLKLGAKIFKKTKGDIEEGLEQSPISARTENDHEVTAGQDGEVTEEGLEQSTSPARTENNPDRAKSSTNHEITEQDGEVTDKELEIILSKMKKPIVPGEKYTDQLHHDSFCIFKIPHNLKKIHRKGYEPETVSIGPYHHGKKHLRKIEEHKYRYLELFLHEAKDGVKIDVLYKAILREEKAIRSCYSEELVEQPKLLKMMLLDGCFILMLFFLIAKVVDDSQHDPILVTPLIRGTIQSDLQLLENQVPLVLLEVLLKHSKVCDLPTGNLQHLASKFFGMSLKEEEESRNPKPKHLLDMIRKNFIPASSSTSDEYESYDTRKILSAKRLRLQGIKFIKASHDDRSSFKMWYCKKMFGDAVEQKISSQEKKILEIKLINGNELHIPPIVFDGIISSVLLNCVAFEQLSMNSSKDITSYVIFMGCLMNEEDDVAYLSEKGIIENYFGNGSDVCQFFKNICKDVAFDMSTSCLRKEFQGINEYTSKWWNVECAKFKHLHFDSPWTLLSSLAVLAAIFLATLQTTFGILSYLHPPNK